MAVERIYWRPIKLVRAGRPESEFSKIGLANDRNIGTPGLPQKRRILSGRRRVFSARILRSCGRDLALHVDDIFNRKPNFSGIARGRPVGDESAISRHARVRPQGQSTAIKTKKQDLRGKKFDEVKSSVSCSYLFEAQGQFDRLAETLGVGDLLASALVKSHLRCQLPQFLAPVRRQTVK